MTSPEEFKPSKPRSSACFLEDLEAPVSPANPSPGGHQVDDANEVAVVGGAIKTGSRKANFADNDSFTTAASTLSVGDFCKICHCGAESNQPLIAPCFCSGSLKYVHQDCLQRWIKSSDIKRCELCKYPFDMQSKV